MPVINGRHYMNPGFGAGMERERAKEEGAKKKGKIASIRIEPSDNGGFTVHEHRHVHAEEAASSPSEAGQKSSVFTGHEEASAHVANLLREHAAGHGGKEESGEHGAAAAND